MADMKTSGRDEHGWLDRKFFREVTKEFGAGGDDNGGQVEVFPNFGGSVECSEVYYNNLQKRKKRVTSGRGNFERE